MIVTEEQRRWWFATHPEYSWRHTGRRSKAHRGDEDKDSDRLSPEAVDAVVDESLKYEKSEIGIALLKAAKFWLGTEFASKTSAEKRLLLWAEEESDESYDNLQAAEGLEKDAFIKELTDAGWSREWAEGRWKLYKRNERIAQSVQ